MNSTKDSSIIKPDNNDNKDIIAQININQPEMIIYPPIIINSHKSKIKTINNIKIMDDNKENILILDQNNANSRCEFIHANNNNINNNM